MKVVSLIAVFASGTNAQMTCSTAGSRGSPPKKCPEGMTCKITNPGRPEIDMPNSGYCVQTDSPKATGLSKYRFDFNKASAAFDTADVDHSKTITFGGAYQALYSLFPKASEQSLDQLTKTGDRTRDGMIDKAEFMSMCRSLLLQQKPIKIATVGPTEKPNGGLTESELKQVENLFQAINTQRSSDGHEYLTYSEMISFFSKNVNSKNGYQIFSLMHQSDQNKDQRVDFKEFVTLCGTLKQKFPPLFLQFLSTAESQNLLPAGSPCVPTSKNQCAKGYSCLPVSQPLIPDEPRHADGGLMIDPPLRYDGHLMPPLTTSRPRYAPRRLRSGYGASSYQCQIKPDTCELCVQSKGRWSGNHCYGLNPNEPQIMDAPMISTVKGCRKKTAMDQAKCSQYRSCDVCTSKTKDKTYGQLCAWAGRCIQNQVSFWRPTTFVTDSSKCDEGLIIVDDFDVPE